MAPLNIVNVVKSFGQAQVLHGVSAAIEDGEFVALVGPSGCGKSTLLRMIAGLETVTSGDIFIDDKRINNLQPKSRDIAMVFQNYALYPHMTVAQNMGFALRLAGTSTAECEKRVHDAAEILGLVDLLARYPRQLSGGQRQRVAMGRAIVRSPKVFLFDEPLSNLDAKLRVQMRSEIKMLHNRLRTTTVFVTHDQIEAMTMADRIVVMHAGRVEQIGPPMELYDRPRNVFVASVIGSPGMNLLDVNYNEGRLASLDGTVWVSSLAGDGSEQALTLGIRPEDVTIKAEGEGTPAEVLLVEPSGSESLVILQVGATRLSALLRERREVRTGDKVGVVLDHDRLHLFSRATGERVD